MQLEAVLGQIETLTAKYQRIPGSVKLLAVSKMQPLALIEQAIALGQRDFGESYLQEAIDKITQLQKADVHWHFIGAIQSNKTKAIATHFDWVHSIDRLKIAQRLHEQRPDALAPLNVCLQVNISGEASKAGVAPTALAELASAVTKLDRLRLRGLMALPAKTSDFEQQCAAFAALRKLYDSLVQTGFDLDTLSMGTSQDFEAAIAEGATLVRLGTSVFGARPH